MARRAYLARRESMTIACVAASIADVWLVDVEAEQSSQIPMHCSQDINRNTFNQVEHSILTFDRANLIDEY